jgi:hypothetical protein
VHHEYAPQGQNINKEYLLLGNPSSPSWCCAAQDTSYVYLLYYVCIVVFSFKMPDCWL